MLDSARTRAAVNLYRAADAASPVAGQIAGDSAVQILDDQGDWCLVKPSDLQKTQQGYVPRKSLVFPPAPAAPVFPILQDASGQPLPSVPPSLHQADLLTWLTAPIDPPWLPAACWAILSEDQKNAAAAGIQGAISSNQASWDAWVADVKTSGREKDALIGEWLVILNGGQDIYVVAGDRVYKQPVQTDYSGWTADKQIIRWTGRVRSQGGYLFNEVSCFRFNLELNGWFRADRTAAYSYPTLDNDPQNPTNAAKVFDLTKPALRIPQDPEIADAKRMGYVGAQYIDIRNATGVGLRHFCLCGEFCIAALCGRDVVPMLKDWYHSTYWRVKAILKDAHEGTGTDDLQNLLKLAGLPSEVFLPLPVSIDKIKARLAGEQFAIAGCQINSRGKVLPKAPIHHWVIVEDVLPVGTSGWVRIFNPFNNQEEVYNFNDFITSSGGSNGLWVTC